MNDGPAETSGGISLAIITARGGSKGLPGKNLRTLGGRSLVRRAVDSAVGAGCFDRVICSTDSPEIAESARAGGAEVPFLRPESLSRDETPSMDVIFHAIDWIELNGARPVALVGLCEPTAPLRTARDVRRAWEMLAADPAAESVVSVTEVGHGHPAWLQAIDDEGRLRRYFPELPMPTRRQDFAAMARPYMLNGAVYIGRVEAVRRAGSFLCPRTLACVMPEHRSVNIDSALDMLIAEAIDQSGLGED